MTACLASPPSTEAPFVRIGFDVVNILNFADLSIYLNDGNERLKMLPMLNIFRFAGKFTKIVSHSDIT